MKCAPRHFKPGTLEAEWIAKEDGVIWLCQIAKFWLPEISHLGTTTGSNPQSPHPHPLSLYSSSQGKSSEQKDKGTKFFVVQYKDLWPRCKIKKFRSFSLTIGKLHSQGGMWIEVESAEGNCRVFGRKYLLVADSGEQYKAI